MFERIWFSKWPRFPRRAAASVAWACWATRIGAVQHLNHEKAVSFMAQLSVSIGIVQKANASRYPILGSLFGYTIAPGQLDLVDTMPESMLLLRRVVLIPFLVIAPPRTASQIADTIAEYSNCQQYLPEPAR